MDYKKLYNEWTTSSYFDEDTKRELLAIKGDEKEIEDREKRGVNVYDFKNNSHITSHLPLHIKTEYMIEDALLFQSYNFVDYLLRTECIKRIDSTFGIPVYEIKKTVKIHAG